jgi:hypothetical protein
MSFYLPHAPFAFPGDVAGLPLSPGCAAGTGTAVAARMAGVVLIEDPQAAGHHRSKYRIRHRVAAGDVRVGI